MASAQRSPASHSFAVGRGQKKKRLVVGDSPYKLRPAASQATSSAGEDQSRGGEAVFATGWRRARRRVARLVPGPDPAGWRQGLRRLGRCRRTGWGVQHSLSKSHVSRSPGNSGSGPSRLISILWFETKGLSWLFDSRTLFPTGTSLGVRKGVACADAWRFTIRMAGKQYMLSGHRGRS